MEPAIILTAPRFPENIGMAARACANMGCQKLIVVCPERWQPQKAAALATPKGLDVLERMEFCETLAEALKPFHYSIAATARLGGVRRAAALNPAQMAAKIARAESGGLQCAIVLGPEDRGLLNSELSLCNDIVTIPTFGASSLNLAQAVLLLLHECRRAPAIAALPSPKCIDHGKYALLEARLREALAALECLHKQNPDYFFNTWRNILRRARLRKPEYDCLMGFCEKLLRKLNMSA